MLKNWIHNILALVYPLFQKVLPYQIYAYLGVGAANTALNIFLFAVLYQYLIPEKGIIVFTLEVAPYTISLLVSFVATVPTGFWLAKNFAFNQNNNVKEQSVAQLSKYFLVVLQGLISDYLLLIALILYVGLYPTIAKILSTVIVLTFNFLLQKYFTFKVYGN